VAGNIRPKLSTVPRTQGAASAASNEPVKYSDFLHLPHGLDGYFDYDQALKAAQAQDTCGGKYPAKAFNGAPNIPGIK